MVKMDHQKFLLSGNSWIQEYEKYLKKFNHKVTSLRSDDEEIHKDFPGNQRFVKESHTLFFNNTLNAVESKRPVQNIYKRPI